MLREGDPLPAIEKLVTQEQIDRYATASGDFNPIHVDREFAAGSQFGATIAHGMLIAAAISEMMTQAFRERWAKTGGLKLRFRLPVYAGERVATFGQVKSVRERDGVRVVECTVGVRKGDGGEAITGDASVTLPLDG